MDAPLRLSAEAFARAAGFLRQARPLERALFDHHFGDGPAAAVHAALLTWQNPDGGFHGLEADIGIPASSVLSTCHALRCLEELSTPANHPIVTGAFAYLRAHCDSAHGIWPIIPPHDNSQPHAPWWHYSPASAENWTGLADNPRPDVLACLLAFPTAQDADLVRRVTADKTLLVVEHDMSVVFSLCDRISVLVYGEILATGAPDEIRSNAKVQAAYLGDAVIEGTH